jgi:hypothetical protein
MVRLQRAGDVLGYVPGLEDAEAGALERGAQVRDLLPQADIGEEEQPAGPQDPANLPEEPALIAIEA